MFWISYLCLDIHVSTVVFKNWLIFIIIRHLLNKLFYFKDVAMKWSIATSKSGTKVINKHLTNKTNEETKRWLILKLNLNEN